MGYYIGGTEQSIVYDFGTKVANSVADCPLKLFYQMVDTNALPNPTTGWTEITSQSTLDKLKYQNEINLTSVNTSGRSAVYNGRNLVVQSGTQPAVRDDYVGKISNSTTINPNKVYRYGAGASLLTPSGFTVELDDSTGAIGYPRLATQDNSCISQSSSVNGNTPQQLFSFDMIRIIEDKYGVIPSVDTSLAGKIAWVKANLSSVKCNWYGFGTCPSGNKVYLLPYSTTLGWKTQYQSSHTATSSTLLTALIQTSGGYTISDDLDSNGFVHFLVYTDACVTTSSSVLVLTNHGLNTDDMIVNNTRGNTISVIDYNDTNSIFTDIITGQVAGDIISKYKFVATGYLQAGTTGTTVKIPSHGLSVGDYVYSSGKGYKVLTVVDSNTLTVDQTGLLTNDIYDIYHFIGTQTAIDGVSQVNTDYVNIELQFKSVVGYDLLVDQNPRRDSGLSNMVLLQKIYSQITDDYTGKVSGSNTVCANLTYSNFATSLISPSGTWYERGQTQYNNIMTLNGVCTYDSNSTNGNIPQQLFSINIVRAFEDAYGVIPIDLTGNSATDLANKIQWLKDNLNTVNTTWVGFGSCPNGNKAYFTKYQPTLATWDNVYIKSNTASSPSSLIYGINGGIGANDIDANGFIHFIAYTDASNGITPSVINTDYIKIDITFKTPNNSMLYFTNNSIELENLTNGKSQALLVEVDLNNVATSLYGGSNSALKSALKNIQVDSWVMASGVLNGALGYKCSIRQYYNDSTWQERIVQSNSSITLASYSVSISGYITSTNKIYVMLLSSNPSDGTLPSQISLDYFQTKVSLNRTADNLPSNKMPVINIPSTWSYFIDINWSHYYNESTSKDYYFWTLFKDTNNQYAIKINSYLSLYLMKKVNGGSWVILQSTNLVPTLKYQKLRLLVEQTPTGMRMRGLLNNGTVIKVINSDASTITGNCSFVPLGYYNGSTITAQADAFVDNYMFMGNKNWDDDNEALTILNGTKVGFQLQELLDKTLSDTQTVNVYPNNLYQITTDKSVTVSEYYNNILLKQTVYTSNSTFITTDKTNKVKLDTSGSFSTLSLKIKMN